ncbi:uncharacterized protein LOC142178308 [Nicotiana tabacum]|uniref:Uncharacterized protein LOC142178308 n=1 Tax=Nicotiana tabacum TaxID=4097 RepID=A0AC58U2N3_TOBAC
MKHRVTRDYPRWGEYVAYLYARFGSELFDDPMGDFKDLRVELSEEYVVSYFVRGLKAEIGLPIKMLAPRTLAKAISLSKIQEQTLIVQKQVFMATSIPSYSTKNTPKFPCVNSQFPKYTASMPSKFSQPSSRPPNVLTTSIKPTYRNTKKLTPAEMEERRSKGLCYNCNEKYRFGHVCKNMRQFFSMEVEEEIEEVELEDEVMLDSPELITMIGQGLETNVEGSILPHVSVHAMNGLHDFRTMRVIVSVKGKDVRVLIDIGSTHNFLDLNTGNKLGCVLTTIDVSVADGKKKNEIEKIVNEMLVFGVIRHSTSHYSSPIVMVKKKDESWRLCVDYRELNNCTVKDKFPIPVIKELLDELHGAKYFSKLDLSWDDHLLHLEKAFKVRGVLDWPLPTTIKGRRGFLGLTGYYRRFIKGYGIIERPLNDLLKKENFQWNPAATAAFEDLKLAITSAPILALSDFSKEFTMETDVSGRGIGAVLAQDNRPIAFLARDYQTRTRHYLSIKGSSYKKGKENIVADALSRKEEYIQLYSISGVNSDLLDTVKAIWRQEPALKHLIQSIQDMHVNKPYYKFQNGILSRKNKLMVGVNSIIRAQLISFYHDCPMGGHSALQPP